MIQDTKKLLDNIQSTLFPEMKVALRTYISSEKDYWSKWILWTDWKETELPNYRQIIPNELVFESDFPTRQENETFAHLIIQKLKDRGYPYNAVFTGSKSIHVHTFFAVPQGTDAHRIDKKKLALRILGKDIYDVPEFDKVNLERTRMIQIECAQNPKTGAMPVVIESSVGIDIPVELADYKETRDFVKSKSEIIDYKKQRLIDNGSPCPCLFLEYAAENKLPSGNRHANVDPNFAAYVKAFPEKLPLFYKYYEIQQKPVINTWLNADSQFNCPQLKKYAESIGITEQCATCKQYDLYMSSRKAFFIKKKELKEKINKVKK